MLLPSMAVAFVLVMLISCTPVQGSSLYFNGLTDVNIFPITVASTPSDGFPPAIQQEFSIDAWVSPLPSSSQPLQTVFMAYANGLGPNQLASMALESGMPFCSTHSVKLGASFRAALTTSAVGGWHHIVCTFSANGTLQITMDSNVTVTTSIPGYVSEQEWQHQNAGYIGSDGASNFFQGGIDSVRLWSFALNSTQIQQLYQSPPLSPFEFDVLGASPSSLSRLSGCIGYWRMRPPSILPGTNMIVDAMVLHSPSTSLIRMNGTVSTANFLDPGCVAMGCNDPISTPPALLLSPLALPSSSSPDVTVRFDSSLQPMFRIPSPQNYVAPSESEITVEMWLNMMKPLPGNPYILFTFQTGSGSNVAVDVDTINQSPTLTCMTPGAVLFGGAVQLNHWTHIVCSATVSHASFFQDGGLIMTRNVLTPQEIGFNYSWFVGQDNAGNYPFQGAIDEIRVYSTALTASMVQSLYLSSPSVSLARSLGCVGYWRFDSGGIFDTTAPIQLFFNTTTSMVSWIDLMGVHPPVQVASSQLWLVSGCTTVGCRNVTNSLPPTTVTPTTAPPTAAPTASIGAATLTAIAPSAFVSAPAFFSFLSLWYAYWNARFQF